MQKGSIPYSCTKASADGLAVRRRPPSPLSTGPGARSPRYKPCDGLGGPIHRVKSGEIFRPFVHRRDFLNRIAVGMFFMLSGYHKLFNPQRHRAFADELKGLGVHAIGLNQWWVPTVEFTAGAAVVIGLLAPLAALGLLVVILVAIVTSGPQRIGVYKPIDEQTGSTIGSICPRSYMPSC